MFSFAAKRYITRCLFNFPVTFSCFITTQFLNSPSMRIMPISNGRTRIHLCQSGQLWMMCFDWPGCVQQLPNSHSSFQSQNLWPNGMKSNSEILVCQKSLVPEWCFWKSWKYVVFSGLKTCFLNFLNSQTTFNLSWWKSVKLSGLEGRWNRHEGPSSVGSTFCASVVNSCLVSLR